MDKHNLSLKFDGYEVKRIILDKENKISNDCNNIGFLFKIVPNAEKNFNKINIIEGVLIKPSKEFDYKLEVIIKGNFRILNCESDDEKYKYILSNAAAILFPYLRATVSIISSQLEYENIVLPVTNFHKLFKNQKLEELLLDVDQYEDF